MKKSFAIYLFLISVTTVSAQEDIYKTVALETCECVAKHNIDTSVKSEVEMALGICMLESMKAHNINIELSDGAAMDKFGEKVGVQMAPICPSIFSVFGKGKKDEEGAEEIALLELSGKIKAIKMDEFLFVILKEESGQEHQLLWLRYFTGSDEFKDDPKKMIGKKVTIVYKNTECYLPKKKTYFESKEIRLLEIN